MNAVKESYWKPEGEEAKCDIGFLHINIASKIQNKCFNQLCTYS